MFQVSGSLSLKKPYCRPKNPKLTKPEVTAVGCDEAGTLQSALGVRDDSSSCDIVLKLPAPKPKKH